MNWTKVHPNRLMGDYIFNWNNASLVVVLEEKWKHPSSHASPSGLISLWRNFPQKFKACLRCRASQKSIYTKESLKRLKVSVNFWFLWKWREHWPFQDRTTCLGSFRLDAGTWQTGGGTWTSLKWSSLLSVAHPPSNMPFSPDSLRRLILTQKISHTEIGCRSPEGSMMKWIEWRSAAGSIRRLIWKIDEGDKELLVIYDVSPHWRSFHLL